MIIHGDARVVLPTLDLERSVVITDPPWVRKGIDIIGAGPGALDLWRDVALLLGACRAVVVFQSSLDPPFPAPPLPFFQTCWLRSVPPMYRGNRVLSHVAYVYGRPLVVPGRTVFPGESNSVTTPAKAKRRKEKQHPCPMSEDHADWLVRWFAHGSCVVDPFAGSGTVIRAAAMRGMECVGIEIDERWVPVAQRALDEGRRQTLLPLDRAVRQALGREAERRGGGE